MNQDQVIKDMTERILLASENTEKVYLSGKRAEYDAFWDSYQDFGNQKSYIRAFGGDCWTEDTFKPKYDIRAEAANGAFAYFGYKYKGSFKALLERQGITLTFPNCNNISSLFEPIFK